MYLITSAIYWLDEEPLEEVSCRCFNILHPFKFHFISLKCLVKQVIKLKSNEFTMSAFLVYLDFASLKGKQVFTVMQFRNAITLRAHMVLVYKITSCFKILQSATMKSTYMLIKFSHTRYENKWNSYTVYTVTTENWERIHYGLQKDKVSAEYNHLPIKNSSYTWKWLTNGLLLKDVKCCFTPVSML